MLNDQMAIVVRAGFVEPGRLSQLPLLTDELHLTSLGIYVNEG